MNQNELQNNTTEINHLTVAGNWQPKYDDQATTLTDLQPVEQTDDQVKGGLKGRPQAIIQDSNGSLASGGGH